MSEILSGKEPAGQSQSSQEEQSRRSVHGEVVHVGHGAQRSAAPHQRDHVARALQSSLLPPSLPTIPGVHYTGVIGDIFINRPTVHLNLKQARREIADPTPVKERGWQEALQAIYPLKIHHFQVNQGDLTYEDEGSFKPLRVRSLNIVATKIRNVRSPNDVYPSPFHLDGAVFESGRVSADGRADFLAEPNVTYRANVVLEKIELDYFKPITNRYNVSVDKGALSAEGAVESARGTTTVDLTRAAVSDVRVDYTHTASTAVAERQQRGQAGAKIREANNAPAFLFRIRELHVSKSTFGFVNKAVTPPYRVFLSDADMTLSNLSNQDVEGPAVMKLTGKFMGTGTATADARFRAEKSGPAFDISTRIDEVNMPSMNDLLRAYGKFDVTAGRFFFYSELNVHNGAISGYVKPFFKDMVVYDPRQDKDKSFFKKAYEHVVGGVAKVLENRPHQDVATRADISGRVDAVIGYEGHYSSDEHDNAITGRVNLHW